MRHFVDQFRQVAVRPGRIDSGVVVLVVEQFVSQLAGVIGRKLDVHRQPQFDGAWADGHQRANVAVGVIELAFLDIAGRIGGKDEIGLAEFLRQQLCQVDSTV
ncbi:hypothetical protein D3C72_1952590 [compost metagenome]